MNSTTTPGDARTSDSAGLGELFDTQLARDFRRHGWVCVRGVLDAARIELLTSRWAEAALTPQRYSDIYPSGRNPTENVPQDDPEARKILQIVRELRFTDPDVDTIARDARVGQMVRSLLGVSSVRLLSEAFLEKPPRSQGSKATPWHQDICYEPVDRRDTLNVWVALDDISADQGLLEFVSGSHRLGPLGRLDFRGSSDIGRSMRDDDLELLAILKRPQDELTASGVPIGREALRAGDAVVFHGLTLHRAPPNGTDRRRRAYQRFYMGGDVLYSGMPDRRTDGLPLKVGQPFESDRFPIVA